MRSTLAAGVTVALTIGAVPSAVARGHRYKPPVFVGIRSACIGTDGAITVRFDLGEIKGRQWAPHLDQGDVRANVKAETGPWQSVPFRSGGEGAVRVLPGDFTGPAEWARVIHDGREISSQVPIPLNCSQR